MARLACGQGLSEAHYRISPVSASTVEVGGMSGEDLNAHAKIRKQPAATWYETASST
jgi:hypothetical protein